MAILGYSLCSSTLLLANKMAISHLPNPSVISFIQILFSATAVYGLKLGGFTVDDWDMVKIKAYALYVVIFVLAIYTNMVALSKSNVETVIVFRACTPIAVSLLEWYYMGRQLPNLRSSIALTIVALGALFYCLCDSDFALHGVTAYFWVMIYFVLITIEMTYGKQLTSAVKMESVWGPVLYCNALAIVPMFVLGYSSGDFSNVSDMMMTMDFNGNAILIFSCVAGTMIGYIKLTKSQILLSSSPIDSFSLICSCFHFASLHSFVSFLFVLLCFALLWFALFCFVSTFIPPSNICNALRVRSLFS